MEHRIMGGVGRVGAIHPAAGDDSHWRLRLLHHADLHRARLASQQQGRRLLRFFGMKAGSLKMPLIVGPVRVGAQTGGKFNFGDVFWVVNKNNLHATGRSNSFNQGSKNFQYSFTNVPALVSSNVFTDMIDNSNFSYLRKMSNKKD